MELDGVVSIIQDPGSNVSTNEIDEKNMRSMAFSLATRFHDVGEGVPLKKALESAEEIYQFIKKNPKVPWSVLDEAMKSYRVPNSLKLFKEDVLSLTSFMEPKPAA